jgi:squalene cyclase
MERGVCGRGEREREKKREREREKTLAMNNIQQRRVSWIKILAAALGKSPSLRQETSEQVQESVKLRLCPNRGVLSGNRESDY